MDKIAEIELNLDLDRLSFYEFCELESSRRSYTFMRDILAKFVWVDGKFASHDIAIDQLNRLTRPQIKEAWAMFWAAIGRVKEEAVTPQTSGVS